MGASTSSQGGVALLVAVAVLVTITVSGMTVPAAAANSSEVYIHPSVESANDETELLIQFEAPENLSYDDVKSLQTARVEAQSAPVKQLNTTDGVTIVRRFWVTNAVLVHVDTETVDIETDLAEIDTVKKIYPNFETESPAPITDKIVETNTHNPNADGLDQINARAAWEASDTRGENVTVAVLDTGVNINHPDINLTSGGWAEFNASGKRLNTEPYDDNGHGTHVTGVVAGGTASGRYVGVAPGVTLLHGKVLNNGGGTVAQIIAGIEWALEHDADVISMSLGIPANSESVYEEAFIEPIRTASNEGTIVVTSSGNTGQGTTGSPGNIYDVIAVGAVKDNGEVPGFSSGETVDTSSAWGSAAPDEWPETFVVPDVVAPGTDVVGPAAYGGYREVSGTSAAAPYVTGTLALMLSAEPNLSPAESKTVLRKSAIHPDAAVGIDDRHGAGVIDAHRAVTESVYNSTIRGTVRTPQGSPAVGIRVRTAYGTTDLTNTKGQFSIPVPPGTRSVMVDSFGYNTSTSTLDVTANESTKTELVVTEAVNVHTLSEQPDVIATNQAFKFKMETENLEAYTPTVDSVRGSVTEKNVSLRLNGDPISSGDTITFENHASKTLTLSVVTDDNTTGTLALKQTFDGPKEELILETGPTEIMTDPQPASFQITETSFDKTVGTNHSLNTRAVVNNVGDYTGTQSVVYQIEIDGTQQSFKRQVELAGGETANLSWAVTLNEFDSGSYDQQINTENDTVKSTFEYLTSRFVITDVKAPKTVTAGETAPFQVTVKNTGSTTGSDSVELAIRNDIIDHQSVSGEPKETVEFKLKFETADRPTGVYNYAIETEDGVMRDSIVIEEPPISSYAGADNIIGNQELRHANNDWRTGQLSSESLRNITDAWRTKTTVAE